MLTREKQMLQKFGSSRANSVIKIDNGLQFHNHVYRFGVRRQAALSIAS